MDVVLFDPVLNQGQEELLRVRRLLQTVVVGGGVGGRKGVVKLGHALALHSALVKFLEGGAELGAVDGSGTVLVDLREDLSQVRALLNHRHL